MAATTADLVNQFIELDRRKKQADDDLEAIKEEMAQLEPQIMERFENAGMQSMKSKSGVVLYIRRQLFAGAAEGATVLLTESLKSAGLGDLVKEAVNAQRLSSWVTEFEAEHFNGTKVRPDDLVQAMPPELRDSLKVIEKYSLRTKKG